MTSSYNSIQVTSYQAVKDHGLTSWTPDSNFPALTSDEPSCQPSRSGSRASTDGRQALKPRNGSAPRARPASAPVLKYVPKPDRLLQAGGIWNQPEQIPPTRKHLVFTPTVLKGPETMQRCESAKLGMEAQQLREQRAAVVDARNRQIASLYRQKLRRAELEERAGTFRWENNSTLAQLTEHQVQALCNIPQIEPSAVARKREFLLHRPDLTEKALNFELKWQWHEMRQHDRHLEALEQQRVAQLGTMELRTRQRQSLELAAGQHRQRPASALAMS